MKALMKLPKLSEMPDSKAIHRCQSKKAAQSYACNLQESLEQQSLFSFPWSSAIQDWNLDHTEVWEVWVEFMAPESWEITIVLIVEEYLGVNGPLEILGAELRGIQLFPLPPKRHVPKLSLADHIFEVASGRFWWFNFMC
jgi:hypothetical protein